MEQMILSLFRKARLFSNELISDRLGDDVMGTVTLARHELDEMLVEAFLAGSDTTEGRS